MKRLMKRQRQQRSDSREASQRPVFRIAVASSVAEASRRSLLRPALPAANVKAAVAVLQAFIDAVLYRIHTMLTENDVQFGDMPQHRSGPIARYRLHAFDRLCRKHGIEHRSIKLSSVIE